MDKILFEYEILMREYTKLNSNCGKENKRVIFELSKLNEKLIQIDRDISDQEKIKTETKKTIIITSDEIMLDELNNKCKFIKDSIGKLKIKKGDNNIEKQEKIDKIKNDIDLIRTSYNNLLNKYKLLELENRINEKYIMKYDLTEKIKQLKIIMEYNEIKNKINNIRKIV